jgi:hypothetical protein
MNDNASPRLLRIPQKFRTVKDVIGVAFHLNLTNVMVLSQRENGDLVFLDTDMTEAQANWLLDKIKTLLLMPSCYEMVNVDE